MVVSGIRYKDFNVAKMLMQKNKIDTTYKCYQDSVINNNKLAILNILNVQND